MAYQTGTGNNILDFATALKDFATAQGWTIGKFDTSAKVLFMEKGNCHATFNWVDNQTQTAYSGDTSGTNFLVNNHYLRCALGSSLNNALSTYFGHPGSLVTSAGDTDSVITDNLSGPFVSWHFFSNATGDYIHASVQATAELWTHLLVGNIDKGDFTHAGAGYLVGCNNVWWRDRWDDTVKGVFNQPESKDYPLVNGESNIYAPDALPAGFNAMNSNENGVPPLYRKVRVQSDYYNNDFNDSYLLDILATSVAPMWSGQTPFVGVPVMIDNVANDQLCVIGSYPDVRCINMEGLTAGQELVLSGDTWKVFPVMRQYPWGKFAYQPSSAQIGLAFKKLV